MGNLCSKCQRTSTQSASRTQRTDSRHSLEIVSLVCESSVEQDGDQGSGSKITEPVLEPPVLKARTRQIQEWTKQSLRDKPFSTLKGKIWTETPSSVSFQKIYTKLSYSKKKRRLGCEELVEVPQIFNKEEFKRARSVRILVQGQGGIGKSTAMKYLALGWADATLDELKPFDFVFHIALKDVQKNQSIEEIIIKQHKGLKSRNVLPAEIKDITENENHKILLLLDGHDEFTPGSNKNIDDVIRRIIPPDSWMIVTSRENEELPEVRKFMDAEAEILGFDQQGIEEYIYKHLGRKDKCENLIDIAKQNNIIEFDWISYRYNYGILSIPFLLHMICVLHLSKVSLPRTRTGIISAIVERCPDWEEIRKTGQKRVKAVEDALVQLGQYMFHKLLKGDRKNSFVKKEILENLGPEAFELGLFIGTESDPMEEEQAQIYCFKHLLFLEFTAGKYVSTLKKEKLQQLFPDLSSIRKQDEVMRFACGLTAEIHTVLEFVYDLVIRKLRHGDCNREEKEFLKSLLQEVPKEVATDPFHNKFMNYLEDSSNNKDIFVPSKYYMFSNLRNRCEGILFHTDESSDPSTKLSAECMVTAGGDKRLYETMRVMRKIQKHHHQVHVNWLDIYDVECSPANSVCDDSVKLLFKIGFSEGFFEHCYDLARKEVDNNVTTTVLKEMLTDNDWKKIGVEKHIEFIIQLLQHKYEIICKSLQMDRTGLTKLIQETITISKNIQLLTMQTKVLPPVAYKHIVNQLHGYDKLEKLNLSETVGVPYELSQCIAEMTSLKSLDMEWCCMSQSMSQSFMKGLAHCTKLTKVLFHGNQLTGSLGNLFSETGLPSLQKLSLEFTGLNQVDIQALSTAVRDDKLPALNHLCLSRNKLTANLVHLFDHCTFPVLRTLEIQNTLLGQSDLNSLSSASAQGQISGLTSLNLSENVLTDCLKDLLTSGSLSLQFLWLNNAELSRNDIRDLSCAFCEDKLSQLKGLSLSGNILTGCLGELLGDVDHPGFNSLEWAHMKNTQLNKDDMTRLTEAVRTSKLSKLWELHLEENNLSSTEDELEILIKTCVASHKQRHLTVNVNDNDLSVAFRERVASFYRGTHIAVCWDIIEIDID